MNAGQYLVTWIPFTAMVIIWVYIMNSSRRTAEKRHQQVIALLAEIRDRMPLAQAAATSPSGGRNA